MKYNKILLDALKCPKTKKYQSSNECHNCKYHKAYIVDSDGYDIAVECTYEG